MKNWQILTLCISIFLSALAATFYMKYERETVLLSNYGPVNLGKIFSESVMVDVSVIGLSGSQYDIKTVAQAASYYDKTKPVDAGFKEFFDISNVNVEEKDKFKYESASPTATSSMKLKIKTYISYSSSNFLNVPYIFTIKEEIYDLEKEVPLKKSVEKIIDHNFTSTKKDVANHLFITNIAEYGLTK